MDLSEKQSSACTTRFLSGNYRDHLLWSATSIATANFDLSFVVAIVDAVELSHYTVRLPKPVQIPCSFDLDFQLWTICSFVIHLTGLPADFSRSHWLGLSDFGRTSLG